MACGLWRVAYGVWLMACGLWRVAYGVWSVGLPWVTHFTVLDEINFHAQNRGEK